MILNQRITPYEKLNYYVVSLALGIASILYGGILAIFIIGRLNWKLDEKHLIIAMFSGIIPIFILWIYQLTHPVLIGWTLFIPIGLSISILIAYLFKKR